MNKETRQICIAGAAVTALLALVIYGGQAAQSLGQDGDGTTRLVSAFRESGAKFEDYTVTGWVQVKQANLTSADKRSGKQDDQLSVKQDAQPSRDLTEEQILRTVARHAAVDLGAQADELTETVRSDGDLHGLRLAGTLEDGTAAEIFVQSMPGSDTYIIITLSGQSMLDSLQTQKVRVTTALESFGPEAKIAGVIRGSFPGRMEAKNMEAKAAGIFRSLKADKLEGINSEGVLSWSGFSPNLPDKLEVAGRTINLNVAVRYSESLNKTLVLLGTPIISTEY